MTDAPAVAQAVASPTVRLAGRDWPVPPLAIRQNRVVVPAIMKLMPSLSDFRAALPVVPDPGPAGDTPVPAEPVDPLWWRKVPLDQNTIDLLCDAVFHALTRGTPGLARNEFDGLEISPFELFAAIPVVLAATGMFKPAEPGRAGEPTGEVTPPTSTPSSPTS
jgi:hypothetical protein